MFIDNPSQIIVIILAVFLALFLLLAIILAVILIKVLRQIQTVTKTAQSAAESVNNIASSLGRFATPTMALRFILPKVKSIVSKRKK